jgi:hypothetical protein
MKATILANASRLRHLHDQIHATFKTRNDSNLDFDRWKKACSEFHESYDRLAFPGGLSIGLKKLIQGDIPTAETAILYLEVAPYCFRSQYVATSLKRALNKVNLPEHLALRFNTWKRLHTKRKTEQGAAANP